jgi:hypothetical protein
MILQRSITLWIVVRRRLLGYYQCCVPGSGRIGVILPDPYPLQPIVKLNYAVLSSRKFPYTVHDNKYNDTYDAEKKDATPGSGSSDSNESGSGWIGII